MSTVLFNRAAARDRCAAEILQVGARRAELIDQVSEQCNAQFGPSFGAFARLILSVVEGPFQQTGPLGIGCQDVAQDKVFERAYFGGKDIDPGIGIHRNLLASQTSRPLFTRELAAEAMKAAAILLVIEDAAVYREAGCTDSAAALEHMATRLTDQLHVSDVIAR